MSKHFYTDIDLKFNHFLKAVLEHRDADQVFEGESGRIFWDTLSDAPAYWDGVQVRFFAYKGETILPENINTNNANRFVSDQDIINWNNINSSIQNYQLRSEKDLPTGYAGLDLNGKIDIGVLKDGMLVEMPTNSGIFVTLANLFDIANGIPRLDDDAKLSPEILIQTGFDADEKLLLVSDDEKSLWNAASGGFNGVEFTTHKGEADGYAPLNDETEIENKFLQEPTLIRDYKTYIFTFSGVVTPGELFGVTYEDETTQYFMASATFDLQSLVAQMTAELNNKPLISAVLENDYEIRVTALDVGYDFDLSIIYTDVASNDILINERLATPAFYGVGNMAGIPTIGWAPLNSFGVIEDNYLPSFRDIRVVDDITALNAIIDQYNGLRVHVIDATDDPDVDDGWAEYLWLSDLSEWKKTIERETSIDMSHDSLKNVQGDGVAMIPPQVNHITDVQYQQLKDSEYILRLEHFDARPGVAIATFDKSVFRAAKITLTIEDHAGSGVVMEEINLLFDGNYPSTTEFAELSSPLLNPPEFHMDHDINNLYLLLTSDSNDSSTVLRVKEYPRISDIVPVLATQADLTPSNGLVPHN